MPHEHVGMIRASGMSNRGFEMTLDVFVSRTVRGARALGIIYRRSSRAPTLARRMTRRNPNRKGKGKGGSLFLPDATPSARMTAVVTLSTRLQAMAACRRPSRRRRERGYDTVGGEADEKGEEQ